MFVQISCIITEITSEMALMSPNTASDQWVGWVGVVVGFSCLTYPTPTVLKAVCGINMK